MKGQFVIAKNENDRVLEEERFLFGTIYTTPGKKYEVLDIRERNGIIEYYIVDDISRAWHYGYNFITIDEIRNGKLEELGI